MSRAEQLIAQGLEPIQAHRTARQETLILQRLDVERAAKVDACLDAYAEHLRSQQPALRIATIDASHLQLLLVARRMPTLNTQWAAMSAHVHTQPCKPWGTPYRIPSKSLMGPMQRGNWGRVLDREASRGATSVRATFGVGIRQLRRESMSHLAKFEGAAS